MQFANISTLIDKVVQAQIHGTTLKSPSLYLYVGGIDPLYFNDSAKIQLVVQQEDLETYLHSYDKISIDSTVCLENCQIYLDFGPKNDVIACQIESKNVIIDVGTEKQKKLKNLTLKAHVDTKDGEIPILPSTRRYLRRIQKQEQARKYLSKASKIDVLNFVKPQQVKQNKNSQQDLIDNPFNKQFETLDTQSLQILKKLLDFVNKDDLLRVLIKQPLRNKVSKKIVRLMVVPTLQTSDQDDMKVNKKMYDRGAVQQLLRQYEARENK